MSPYERGVRPREKTKIDWPAAVVVIFIFLFTAAVVSLIPATIIYVLYNWIVPDVLGWPRLGFWQVAGLMWLMALIGKLVFKSGTS